MSLTPFSTYPDHTSPSDFVTRSDSFVLNLNNFSADWSDIAGRSPVDDILTNTSATSQTINSSQKTIVLATDKPYLPGMYVMMTQASDQTKYVYGTVNSYTPATKTLVVDPLLTGGSGTPLNWYIHVSAGRGKMGGSNSRVKVRKFSATLGSTNTRILQYGTVEENVGSGITAATSAANGASFTITKAGLYFVCIAVAMNAINTPFGISKNSAQLTTNIDSITNANRVISTTGATETGIVEQVSGILQLAVGDVLRPHVSGTVGGSNSDSEFFLIASLGF